MLPLSAEVTRLPTVISSGGLRSCGRSRGTVASTHLLAARRGWLNFLPVSLHPQNLLIRQRKNLRRRVSASFLNHHRLTPTHLFTPCKARKCASAWARTFANPAGFVIRALCPASEFDHRLHSSNSTAWLSSSKSTATVGSTTVAPIPSSRPEGCAVCGPEWRDRGKFS